MKKLLLASAVAALSITAAQAAPTVYGKAFLTLDINEGDTKTTNVATGEVTKTSDRGRSQLNSVASRIGFKGSEALTANTDLVYQLEYRLDVDKDAARNFESRDTYLGLSNKQYGTLVAGRLSAIDDYIQYAKVVKGGVLGGDDSLARISAPRANNTFAYFTPSYNGLQGMAMYTLDENNSSDNLGGDAWGVGVKYEPSDMPLKAGLTYIQANQLGAAKDTTTLGGGENANLIRLSGAYGITPELTIGGQYQLSDFNTADNENAFMLSGKYKLAQTPWSVYSQVDYVDSYAGLKDSERTRLAVGATYDFNKATTGHIYGAYLKEDSSNATSTTAATTKVKFDGVGIGGGIEYKF
ncbi:MAG: porin [Moraxella sp.]|nr:porin [Moraxella sp.]